jgi:hypothetical protein
MKTDNLVEREFRYGMDGFTLVFLLLLFGGFAGALVWHTLVNTDNGLLHGYIYLPRPG